MDQVTLPAAFGAGLISFVSPCVLPLVPPYLVYLGGTTLGQLTGTDATGEADAALEKAARRRVLLASIFFVLGFTTVFVALGASASAVGQFVRAYSRELAMVAGVVIIVMGLHFLGVFKIGLLYREARVQVEQQPAGLVGAFVMGLAFAFGWTPCIGPILSVILAVAATGDTVGSGMVLLAAYSLGLGVPFVLAAAFSAPFMQLMKRFRRHMGMVERAMGVLLVAAGLMFLTGQMASLSYWLLETFPALGTIG